MSTNIPHIVIITGEDSPLKAYLVEALSWHLTTSVYRWEPGLENEVLFTVVETLRKNRSVVVILESRVVPERLLSLGFSYAVFNVGECGETREPSCEEVPPLPETLPVQAVVKQLGDAVNHPTHYNAGTIEAIEVIEDWNLGFNLGSVVKYLCRSEHKGTALQDLKKARWYLDREIANAELADSLWAMGPAQQEVAK